MKDRLAALAAVIFMASVAIAGRASAQALPLIDVHFHIEPGANVFSAVDGMVQLMDRHGIRRAVLMSPPRMAAARFGYEADDLQSAVAKYGSRIALAAGGGSLNVALHATPAASVTEADVRRFKARAEELAARAVAFGEIAAHHLSLRSMGPHHGYQTVPPDHPYLLALADVAAAKDIPIDLHIDVVPADMDLPVRPVFNPQNPQRLPGNLAAFERLLAHNRGARIVWAHAGTDPLGTRTPELQRALLSRHPNLYVSVRLSRGAPLPAFALDPGLRVRPAWVQLIADFPDRFVFGSDYFQGVAGAERGPEEASFDHFRAFLAHLPPQVAEAVAYRNAERIYRLQ